MTDARRRRITNFWMRRRAVLDRHTILVAKLLHH